MAITFKCPQCVSASLTSKVAFVQPLKTNNGLLWFDVSGNFHIDNTLGNIYIYLCTNNHCGPVVAPTDPINGSTL